MGVKSRPIRSLHIIGSLQKGGAEAWCLSLLSNRDPERLSIDFCCTKGERGPQAEFAESLGAAVLPCSVRPILTFPFRFRKIIKKRKYDVVHSHVSLFSGFVVLISYLLNVPVRIAYSHNVGTFKKMSLARRIYCRCMRILINEFASTKLACSTEAYRAIFDAPPDCKDILHCCIDIEKFRPGTTVSCTKESLGIPGKSLVIGHVGGMRKQKNHDFLVDIAAELCQMRRDVYFVLAGGGELEDDIRRKVEVLGLGDRVRVLGVRDDCPDLMRGVFDVFVFPSLKEGLGLVLVEAAAAGLPIICSDTISREVCQVSPDLFTRLSPDLSAKQWAEAILATVVKARIDPQVAFDRVRQTDFTPERSVNALTLVYERALQRPEGGGSKQT